MLTRLHKILIGLFVAQLTLAVIMLAQDDESAAAREVPVLAGFDAAKVTRIQITAPDKPAIDLVKRGDAWALASSFDHPVEASRVSDLLTPLAKMAAAAPIATSASRHKQLRVGVQDHERRLVLTVDGKDTALYIGSAAGTRRTAVRKDGDDRVFAVQGVSAYAAGIEPQQWVETSYLRVPREEVAKVTIDRGGKRVELAKGDTWAVTLDGAPLTLGKDETLDTSALDGIVSSATSLDLVKPGDPTRDASAPLATITIERTGADNASVAAVVYDVIADGEHYWVRQRGVDRAALVDKSRLTSVLEIERAKLVSKPEPT